MKIKTEKLLEYTKKRIEEEYKKEIEKRERGEFEEAEDSLGINFLWWLAGFFLVIADILEIVFDLIATGTAGVLFILPYISLFFEIPGAIVFTYLVWHYIRKNVIGRVEGLIYIIIVFYELIITFVPLAQLTDIFPSKTLGRVISRWRIKRLMQVKKRIKGEKEEKKEEE